jgi:hypothetical protein
MTDFKEKFFAGSRVDFTGDVSIIWGFGHTGRHPFSFHTSAYTFFFNLTMKVTS